MSATADPLPFVRVNSLDYSPKDFIRSALYSGPSKNALKQISKIELLKDTRAMDGHWRHEFLVFTVDDGEQELYFERHVFEDTESWMGMFVFAWNLFQGDALDILTFREPECEEVIESKHFSKPSECRGLGNQDIIYIVTAKSFPNQSQVVIYTQGSRQNPGKSGIRKKVSEIWSVLCKLLGMVPRLSV